MIAASRFVTIASSFTAVFFDQYGVLHDGQNPYPGAKEALAALKARGTKIAVLSNSGRTAAANSARMKTFGFEPDLYDFLVTSGDVARTLLKQGCFPRFLEVGARCFVISTAGDDDFTLALGVLPTHHCDEADIVIIAGSQADKTSLDEYRALLAPAAQRGTPCLCVNPDKLMLTRSGNAPGAGRIAEIYEELGGVVTWVGKPFPEIYRTAAELTQVKNPRDILCVGDSVEHDIAGAHAFGALAALVRTGVLRNLSEKALADEIGRHGVAPDFVIENLTC